MRASLRSSPLRLTPYAASALALAALAAIFCANVSAGMYKCVNDRSTPPGSNPIYQDTPCPPGKELRNFETDPADVSVIPHQEVTEGRTQAAPKPSKALPAAKSDKKKGGAAVPDDSQRRFIARGMSEAEVVARIGAPDITSGGKGRKSSRWSYLPVSADPQTITTVVFDAGRVIEVERKVVH